MGGVRWVENSCADPLVLVRRIGKLRHHVFAAHLMKQHICVRHVSSGHSQGGYFISFSLGSHFFSRVMFRLSAMCLQTGSMHIIFASGLKSSPNGGLSVYFHFFSARKP